MRTRILGWTGEKLSSIGLGTWAIGGGGWQFGWGPQDDDNSIRAIHRALEAGVNWIDTARVYGLGHSEEIVGRAIADVGGEVFIATKCGRSWDSGGRIFGRLKGDVIREECESSLQQLGVDVIDLYQIHWPQPASDVEEAWTEIAKLIEEGKVRYGGVSNFSLELLKQVQKIHPVASLQPPYNMFERDVEEKLLQHCAENGIGVVAYSPMMAGLLTGKFSEERLARLPDDDWRARDEHFTRPEFSVNLDFVERLRPIAERNDLTIAQLAIAWVLRRPEVTSAIVGARRPDQINETAPAGDVDLSGADIQEIEDLLQWREDAVSASV